MAMGLLSLAHHGVETVPAHHLFFHPTRFDDRAGPLGLFFLHYYPLILVIGGLLLFVILRLRIKTPKR
ncbi:MAG: hypothetical protein HY567_01510 [Candidatus Kerfeldbacteria bacterium]|nr:hypothetical protein [Candidatus Kerfeldbacteria bacterium]